MRSICAPSRNRAISLRLTLIGSLWLGASLAHADDFQYSSTERHISAHSYLVDPAAPPDEQWVDFHSDGYATRDQLPIERTTLTSSSRGVAVGMATATQSSTIDLAGLAGAGRAHHFAADSAFFLPYANAESEIDVYFTVTQRRLARWNASATISASDGLTIAAVGIGGPGVSIELYTDEYAPSVTQAGSFFMAPGHYGVGAFAISERRGSSTATFEFRLVTRLLGDMNCDGALNVLDLDSFWLALYMPSAYRLQYGVDCDIELGDINMDGGVNRNDIDPFVALLIGG